MIRTKFGRDIIFLCLLHFILGIITKQSMKEE